MFMLDSIMGEIANLTIMRVTVEKRRETYQAFFPRDLDTLPFPSVTTGQSECTEDKAIVDYDETSSSL